MTRRSRRSHPAFIVPLAGAALLGACSGQSSTPAPQACAAVEETLSRSASSEAFAGQYDLTMVATTGDSAGRTARGTLILHAHEGDMRVYRGPGGRVDTTVTLSQYGTTDITPETVGAVRMGSLDSMDPNRPGVLVIERRTDEAPSIIIRLGSQSNERGVFAFDAGFTALTVHSLSENGFAGSWRSGVRGPEVEGYFCAVRR
jgi:hypothetical protein